MLNKNNICLKIAICVTTYKRPEMLRQCLESLANQKFKRNSQPDCRLVIIDNDASHPLVKKYNSLNNELFTQVIHELEPERGISSARNRAIKAAGEVDFVAFIDDDEVALPYWLDELIFCQKKYHADVVTGPVISRYSEPCPEWVMRGRFFERQRYQTGSEMRYAGHGNVLIQTRWLNTIPGPYDIKMNLTGGEDALFSALIRKNGAKIIWADEAIAYETIPYERMTIKWLWVRAVRAGSVITLVEAKTGNPLKVKVIRLMKGFAITLTGLVTLIPNSIIKGLAGFVQSLVMLGKGLGELIGIVGLIPQEYK